MGMALIPLETGTMIVLCPTKITSRLSREAKTFYPQVFNLTGQNAGEIDNWTLNLSGFLLGFA